MKSYFRQRSNDAPEPTSLLTRISIISGLLLIAFLTWHTLNEQIWQQTKNQIAENRRIFNADFNSFLLKTPKTPRQLLVLGQKLAPSNLELAILVFEDVAFKNENYRDAYVSLGLGYLKQSQLETNKDRSRQKLNMAKDALEKAAKIDPIYAYTYQLQQIVYKTLDDKDNFELAKKHYETVSNTGNSQ